MHFAKKDWKNKYLCTAASTLKAEGMEQCDFVEFKNRFANACKFYGWPDRCIIGKKILDNQKIHLTEKSK